MLFISGMFDGKKRVGTRMRECDASAFVMPGMYCALLHTLSTRHNADWM